MKAEVRRKRFLVLATLLFLVILVIPSNPYTFTSARLGSSLTGNHLETEGTNSLPLSGPEVSFNLADSSIEGLLNPASIEQKGYLSSDNQTALTDRNPNVGYDFPIDDAHDWMGSSVEVNIWNLTKTFVSNGTFDEGIPGINEGFASGVQAYPFGWNTWGYSPDTKTIQRTGYIAEDRKYVLLETEGDPIGTGVNYRAQHTAGTLVQFNQTIMNAPYSESFVFEFDFSYVKGPLGLSVGENISLVARADGIVVWSTNLADLAQRNQWYSTGRVEFNKTGMSDTFLFQVALELPNDLQIYVVDYGFTNAAYFTVYVDDVVFDGVLTPGFDEVDLQFEAGSDTASINGTAGTGSASISNSSYWRTSPFSTRIVTNTTVSYNYRIRLKTHRFTNSAWTTDTSLEGTSYSVSLGESSLLSYYAYIGFLGDYEDLTQIFRFPSDWVNVSILDPFKTPVTGLCNVSAGQIVIPTSIMDRLGWWEVTSQSPNYAKTTVPEVYDSGGDQWNADSIFRSSTVSRIAVSIGSGPNTPDPLNLVNITWMMPNGTTWFYESISGGITGAINSSELEFGSLNTTAGQWQVLVAWTNGTELAFGSANYEVHHGTNLSPHVSAIGAESGLSVSNFIYFQDSENGEFITNPIATITGNWSATTVNFIPDPIQNRWVGTFNTSLVGPGSHLVVVNASISFFDDASCTFLVTISFADNDLTIDNPTTAIGIGDTYLTTFSYSDVYGVGIPDANVSIDYTGTTDGVTWGGLSDLGGGDYSVEFTAVHSGSYAITISASKDYYQESEDALFILIGERSTNLSLENGTSAVISFNEQYRLVVRYTNGSGFGLDSASVSVLSISPDIGIDYTASTNEGNGYFSIILTPSDTGTYTLLINASLADHRTQYISFTLTANTIATQLQIASGLTSVSVGVGQTVEILVFYEQIGSTTTNISMATIVVNFTSYVTLIPDIFPQAEGYLLQFSADQTGLYEFTITASKTGFQSDIVQFTLLILERAIRVEMDAPVWERRSNLNISLNLFEVESGDVVTDALVSYKLYRFLGVEMEGYLNETSPGIYTTYIAPAWYDGSGYSIRIFLEKENFALDQDYEFTVFQITPPDILWIIMVETFGPPIGGLAVVSIVSLSGLVVYRRKKKAEFVIDLANKHRFDDADNIIGVIVMHKSSGIPIYSRIVKGGFEEGIVAAFISAVTHFRQEFEMSDEEAMRVIPISDIIRAVHTRNLICAFITVRSASIDHNRKMEVYGMQVSTYLDDIYEGLNPSAMLDTKIAEMLDYIYEITMDGSLIRYYKVATSEKFPRRLRQLERLLHDEKTKHCSKPVLLAKSVSNFGVSEARGCTLVLEAIESDLIIQCEDHETVIPEFDFAEFFEERNGNSDSKPS